MAAAMGGHTATVTALHSLGADVKAAANNGETAVIYAAAGGHTATVTALHSLGADIKLQTTKVGPPSWLQRWEGTRRR